MGTSLALAAKHALHVRADSLLICLADMPLVPESHFKALSERMAGLPAQDILVSSDGIRRTPPAAFGVGHFEKLRAASQDVGARGLLSRGECVPCDASYLADIDDAETLQRLS